MTTKGVVLSVKEKSVPKRSQEKVKEDPHTHMIDAYLRSGKSMPWIAKELGMTVYKIKQIRKLH